MARSHLQEAVSSHFIDGIERRSSPRADIVVRVNYQTVDSLFSEFARNINDGGIFVETDTPQPVGTSVELEFKLPGADRPIEVIGNVVRSIETDQATPDLVAGMGIEFENLDSDVREQINKIIQRLRATGATKPDASA
ncbi:MAG: TIGR02266 family protein [Deltaproteobacteria bacterium]|jgi:type IV pilus assembly protein PilZ|nr:TIGR02266 family protein [Deltaproteobacteria bacterium]MBW2542989.1 TIGR02266 family protein [Deltaproteobacteria bacterium]